MRKFLYLVLLLPLIFFACKAADDDKVATVTLTSSADFKTETFATGCLIISSTAAQCVCYEGGTEYTGAASLSVNCKDVASNGGTLVAGGTIISNVAAGNHYYCSTTNPAQISDLCSDGDVNTSTAVLSSSIAYTITYIPSGRSISN